MITFQKFQERLARGQLKNMSAVDDTNLGDIDPEYVDTIVNLTNQGLTDITTKLPVIKKQVDLIFQPNLNLYALDSSNLGSYLDDSQTEAFLGEDYIKVLEVFTDSGKTHTPNTDGHLVTPTYDTIRFTKDKMRELGEGSNGKIRIQYQAKHPEITEAGNIYLPPNLVTALQLFVAALYIRHMNSSDHTASGDSYYGVYLQYLGADRAKDMSSVSEVDLDVRLNMRGFV